MISNVLVCALGRSLLLGGAFAVGQLKVLRVAVKRQYKQSTSRRVAQVLWSSLLRYSHTLLPLVVFSHAGKQLPVSLIGVL